jgi:nucleoporin POM152
MPVEIELLRTDIDTGSEERIKLTKREVNTIVKELKAQMVDVGDATEGHITVKKPGVYQLSKVLDEYKLEVQRLSRDTYVVPCPKARFRKMDTANRCIRDLSDLTLEVEGTPPLKIMYARSVNGQDNGFHFQSLQPDGFSPLSGTAGAVTSELDLSWVRPAKVTVPLNETLIAHGTWEYTINEVHDSFGNVVSYAPSADELDPKPPPKHLIQEFTVFERPKASLRGCNPKTPLKVAKGMSTGLSVRMSLSGPAQDDSGYAVTWKFTPIDKLTNSGEHSNDAEDGSFRGKSSQDLPQISRPGLYSLTSIESKHCAGEIEEPSSCMLLNPPEPQLSIRAEDIPDKCAGNSVGLRVDLDLVGTPPFAIRYDVISGGVTRHEHIRVNGLRHQMELRPATAGKHQYIFRAMDDVVYKNRVLVGDGMVLEQDVKPAASAIIETPKGPINACLDDEVDINVKLIGDPPFTLEWEMFHDGKKKPFKATDITESSYRIVTALLSKGGDYILSLNSVQDKSGCRSFLKDEVKIHVRRQKPRAAFGLVEGKRSVMVVEKTSYRIPLRLQGEGPWSVSYRNHDIGAVLERQVSNPNDYLLVKSRGMWELVGVSDRQCRGRVDAQASTFEVGWEPRPDLAVAPSQSITGDGRLFVKNEVCEGDIDGFEISLGGKLEDLAGRSQFLANTSRSCPLPCRIRGPPSAPIRLCFDSEQEARRCAVQGVHPT